MSTQQFMAAFNQSLPPSPKAALPVVTFGDGVTLHLNGDAIHVVHVANAHTDGDSLDHWQKADVLHTGDTFVTVSFPAGFITAEKFVEAVYNSLRSPPRAQDSKHRH